MWKHTRSLLVGVELVIVLVYCVCVMLLLKNSTDSGEVQSGVELMIVDKKEDVRLVPVGNTLVRSVTYYLVVDFGGTRQNVTCTSAVYTNVQIGDSLMFSVYCDSEGELLYIKLE